MSRRLSNESQASFEQIQNSNSFQTITTASSSCQISISENFEFQQLVNYNEFNQQQQEVFQKYLAKIENNESTFQIFRPKGDLQPVRDEEEASEEEEAMHNKYKIYSKLLEPLKGQSFYSLNTLKLKLQMDLLMLEQFDANQFSF